MTWFGTGIVTFHRKLAESWGLFGECGYSVRKRLSPSGRCRRPHAQSAARLRGPRFGGAAPSEHSDCGCVCPAQRGSVRQCGTRRRRSADTWCVNVQVSARATAVHACVREPVQWAAFVPSRAVLALQFHSVEGEQEAARLLSGGRALSTSAKRPAVAGAARVSGCRAGGAAGGARVSSVIDLI